MARFVPLALFAALLTACFARTVPPPAPLPSLGALTSRAGPGWTWVSWQAAAGVTMYTVYRAEKAAGPWRYRAATRGTSYTDRRVTNGIAYYYAVRAKRGEALGPYSRVALATPRSRVRPAPAGPPPAAPTDLTATWYPGKGIALRWTDAATGETGYRVSRRANDGKEAAVLGRLKPNTESFFDHAVPPGEVWVYRVYAVAGPQVSGYSNPAIVAIPLGAPQGLVAHALSASVARLRWRAFAGARTGFRVERRIGNGAFRLAAILPPSASGYDNRRLRPKTTYGYRVAAIGKSGDSPWSNEARVSTRPLPVLGAMIKLPAGCYRMGGAAHVCVRSFSVDMYEVTNAQYLACLRAGACTPPAEWSATHHPGYFTAVSYASYPVVNVSWEQAAEYCRWRGKRLPDEAEWEYAARGGPRANRVPLSAPDCSVANVRGDAGCALGTVRVASYLPNDIGAYDMLGNVWEWTAGGNEQPYAGPRRHVRRGGAWTSEGRTARPDNRALAREANNTTGFRCAN